MKAAVLKLKAPPPPLERDEQRAFFDWLYYIKDDGLSLWEHAFAIPNGSYLHGDISRRAIQGRALRLQGVKAGVPDVFFAIPRKPYSGCFIEFKRIGAPAPKPDDDQSKWHARLRAQGYFVAVCYGFEEARTITIAYFRLQGVAP